ncbi:MAG: hypothetical protein KKC68_09410 [Candidatus Thermoplasmatota archaeon]|nr:hypothetical protein [Candidatus Thermoplasmatota archaeon]MBU1941975.1 hypothetical protein [Candidatus Thermoplasmatota archaeon]
MTFSEITQELATIKNKGILSPDVILKIQQRLQNNQIKLTQNQLYELINKINTALKKQKTTYSHQTESSPVSVNNESELAPTINFKDNTMQQLVENLEKIEQRLNKLEQTTFQYNTVQPIKKESVQDRIEPLQDITNDAEHIVVLMKWLQYLVDKIGKNQLSDILSYYVDIGWISDDVRLDMLDYAKGIIEESTKEGTKKPSTISLSTRDHIQSLLYIQKLKDQQLDERFMSRIDREMDKMSRSIDQYQMK